MFKRFFAKACCTRGRPQIVHFGRRAPCRAVLSGSDGCGGGTDVKLDDFNTQLTRTSTYPTFSTAGLSALKAALDARVKELVWGPVSFGAESGRQKASEACPERMLMRVGSRARAGRSATFGAVDVR